MSFIVVIPARYASTRLPGKPLMGIAGKTMVERVYDQAILAGAKQVIIATDDERIRTTVENFGGQVCMTSPEHNSGTERLAEVVQKMKISDDEIIVNVQGDEPLIPPEIVKQVAENLAQNQVPMATLATEITDEEELFNPNAVKVVTDSKGNALYFSRAPIPWDRDNFTENTTKQLAYTYLRHIGIYAYRAGFINTYVNWPASQLEQVESLEQLRVLWYGEKIHVELAKKKPAAGVDTKQDLEKVRQMFC